MFEKFKRKKRSKPETALTEQEKAMEFAKFQITSTGQRTSTGERGEMCSNAMNNNQRFAALQMLRDFDD